MNIGIGPRSALFSQDVIVGGKREAGVAAVERVIGQALAVILERTLGLDHRIEHVDVGGFRMIGVIDFRKVAIGDFQRAVIALGMNPQDRIIINERPRIGHRNIPPLRRWPYANTPTQQQ
jgi:hypothetical protein